MRCTTTLNGVLSRSWGRRLIERHAGKAVLGELDYLLHSPDDRAGALGFGLGPKPPAPQRAFNNTIMLAKLQAIADAIVADEELPPDPEITQAQELLLVGLRRVRSLEFQAGGMVLFIPWRGWQPSAAPD
jgi:hypothetical protein